MRSHRLLPTLSPLLVSGACGGSGSQAAPATAPPAAEPAVPAAEPVAGGAEAATPAAAGTSCATPVACFRAGDDLAQEYNRTINGPAEFDDDAAEALRERAKTALQTACDGGHACACMALKTGDCNDAAACSEMDGERCTTTCADELGCSTEAFVVVTGS